MKAAVKRFVLDASVTVASCSEEESTTFTEAIGSSFRGSGSRRSGQLAIRGCKRIVGCGATEADSAAQVTALLGRILHLPVSVENVEPDVAFTRVLSVARQQKLTEYDAAYVELALRNGFPLVTFDDQLRQAARTSSIALLYV